MWITPTKSWLRTYEVVIKSQSNIAKLKNKIEKGSFIVFYVPWIVIVTENPSSLGPKFTGFLPVLIIAISVIPAPMSP